MKEVLWWVLMAFMMVSQKKKGHREKINRSRFVVNYKCINMAIHNEKGQKE